VQFSGNFASYAFNYNSTTSTYTVYGSDGSIDTVTGVESFQFADGSRTPAQLPITSGAPVRSVSVTALNATQNEGNTGSTVYSFEVRLNAAAFSGQTVSYAVAGTGANPTNASDFTGSVAGTVTFAAGETVKTVVVSVAGDTIGESNETFALNLSAPTSGLALGTASATSTIVNDDNLIRNVSITAATASAVEGNTGTTPFTFNVTLDAAATSAQSVRYTVAGTGANPANTVDFSGALSGSVNFAAGESVKTVTVYVSGDNVFEANESFGVTLSAPTAGLTLGTTFAQMTITNDDTAPIGINLTEVYRANVLASQSSTYGGFAAANLLDNNVSTFDHTLNGADEWVKIDLAKNYEITSVEITNRLAGGSRLNGAVVKVLDAGGAVVFTSAPIANAHDGEKFVFNLPVGVVAESVIVDGVAGQYLNLAEVDVFGLPIPVNLTDVFRGQVSATQSSTYGSYSAARLLDNDSITFNHTLNGADEWVKIDLGGDFELTSINLINRAAGGYRLDGATINALDASGALVYTSAPIVGATDGEHFVFDLPDGVVAESVVIDGASGQFLNLAEVDIFGIV
jgi:F5/8 type C domain/Calx-beta domain